MAAKRPSRKAVTKGAKKPAKKAFGRPGTAGKPEGSEAVRRWMRGVDPAQRPIVEKLDALIGATIPNVKRAVKWSMPMYGLEGQGWIAHIAAYKNHVSLGFFAGTRLDPPPPSGEGKGMRRVNIRDMSEFDENRFRSWIKQASSMKGWGTA